MMLKATSILVVTEITVSKHQHVALMVTPNFNNITRIEVYSFV